MLINIAKTALCALLVVACQASPVSNEKENRKSEAECSDCKEILTIEMNSEKITIYSGSKEIRYTVKNLSGETVFSMIDEEQLKARRPEAFEFVKKALAGKVSADLDRK